MVVEDAEVFLLRRSVHVVAHVLVRNETAETVTLTPDVWVTGDGPRLAVRSSSGWWEEPRPVSHQLPVTGGAHSLPPHSFVSLRLEAELRGEGGLDAARELPCLAIYSMVVDVPQVSGRHGVHPAVNCLLPLRSASTRVRVPGLWVWGE